jgi:hypothetical protein
MHHEIFGRTHHLLVSVWGRRWKEVHLAMFTAYLDDSGTDPNQAVAIATAIIIPAAQIIRLEREWENLKKKEGFSCFHTSEMIARNKKSEFADWDDEKVDRVFRRVREISMKFSIATGAVSFAVKKSDYDEVVPPELRAGLGNHYTWAVRHVITFIDSWKQNSNNIKSPMEYVFDWIGGPRDPRRVEVEDVMAQGDCLANLKGFGNLYSNYSFRRLPDIPGLQCVDPVGWVCYRKALQQYSGKPPHPLAQKSWKHYGADSQPNGWLAVITLKRENLQKWVSLEVADGRTLKRLEEWQTSLTMSQ